jgi:hypothetical protein
MAPTGGALAAADPPDDFAELSTPIIDDPEAEGVLGFPLM